MEESDIRLYLKAKKETWLVQMLVALALICACALIGLESFDVEHDYTILLSTINTVCLLGAIGSGRWVSVSREDLLKLVKKQIDSNSTSLQKLNSIRSGVSE